MYRFVGLLLTIVAIMLFGFGLQPEQALSQPGEVKWERKQPTFAPGRILVKLKDQAPPGTLRGANRETGAQVETNLAGSQVSVLDLPANLTVGKAIEAYENVPGVEYAEPDYLLYSMASKPNDPEFSKQYALDNTGQNSGMPDADIDAPEAWDQTTGNTDVVVAVIDTGVDISHPDLKNNVWTNPSETPANGLDDDKNGYVDDVHGWDFHYEDNTVFDSATDDAHGTHVAGTIAAEGNNGIGVAGVNWRAKVMPLKFIGPGNKGYASDAIEAINYATAMGVKISNNSYGGFGYSKSMLDAIERAGAAGQLYFASAGNGGDDGIGDDNDATPRYPSSYGSPNIVAVAATDKNDALASFSNYGATSVDLAAPGVSVLSTLPSGRYGSYSGTSMATPHVSGVAALLKSKYPSWDSAQTKAQILQTVDGKASLQGKMVSGGRLNAAGALGSATTQPPEPEPSVMQDTKLTLSASPTLVDAGATTTLSGELSTASGPLGDRTVTVWRSSDGGSSWTQDGTAAYDASSKTYRASRSLSKKTTFQLRFAEEAPYKAAASPTVLVEVRAKTSKPKRR